MKISGVGGVGGFGSGSGIGSGWSWCSSISLIVKMTATQRNRKTQSTKQKAMQKHPLFLFKSFFYWEVSSEYNVGLASKYYWLLSVVLPLVIELLLIDLLSIFIDFPNSKIFFKFATDVVSDYYIPAFTLGTRSLTLLDFSN